jgi:hypothetical protein
MKSSEEMRCFVDLVDGTKQSFPTATEIRDTSDGGIEIWNDRIFLASFKKGEFLGRWINPRFLIDRKTRQQRLAHPGKRTR